VKLETGLRSLGIPFRTIGRGAPSAALDPPPALVIVDLSDAALDPLGLTQEIRARRELGSVPVIGFAAHEDRELRDAARAAGCSLVVSRSRLSGALPDVLEPFHAALGRRGAGRSPSRR
jgi:DNA-binding NarL/FixJ family response regulator